MKQKWDMFHRTAAVDSRHLRFTPADVLVQFEKKKLCIEQLNRG